MTIHEALEKVVRRTETAFIAKIVGVREIDDSAAFAKTLAFEVNPVRTIFGTHVPAPSLTCLYTEGRPHVRGALAVSPLVSGSGLELQVKPGDEMIFLVANVRTQMKAGSDACKLLRIETVQNESLVTRAHMNATRPTRL